MSPSRFLAVVLCLVGLSFGGAALLFYPVEADAQAALPGRVLRTSTSTACDGSCTGGAPSGALAGVSLAQASAVRVRVCAAETQGLSGAGSLQAYVRDESDGLWSRAPALDKTVTVAVDGERCATFDDWESRVPYGRVTWVPFGVTVSGGADLTVTLYVATLRK